MERLRTPLFLLAVLIMALVVCLELGSPWLQRLRFLDRWLGASQQSLQKVLGEQLANEDLDADQQAAMISAAMRNRGRPPGRAIRALGLLDGVLLFTMILMAVALVVPERVHAKYQGVVTLFYGLSTLGASALTMLLTTIILFVMVVLLMSFPFGTIAYLCKYGSFPKGQAIAVLGLITSLRFLGGLVLVFAHQRFVQNKGLVLMFLCAMLGGIIVALLHGAVPGILVSITDALATIVVCLLALIVSIILLISSIISIVKLIG